jgi:hypothetical protein
VIDKEKLTRVLALVEKERELQHRSIEAMNLPVDCADQEVPNAHKLAVLVEEVGEVAKSLIEFDAPGFENVAAQTLFSELIQVAAVACAWAESLT